MKIPPKKKLTSIIIHPHCYYLCKIPWPPPPLQSLQSFLDDVRLFNEHESRLLFLQILSAVNYLHLNGIAHNDLYPQNILVGRCHKTGGLALKVADFGWAEVASYNEEGESDKWTIEVDLELLPSILSVTFFLPSFKPSSVCDLFHFWLLNPLSPPTTQIFFTLQRAVYQFQSRS